MIGVEPDQVSPDSVRLCPSVVVPVMTGRWVFAGATPATAAVDAEAAEALPPELAASTTTTMVWPTSGLVRV